MMRSIAANPAESLGKSIVLLFLPHHAFIMACRGNDKYGIWRKISARRYPSNPCRSSVSISAIFEKFTFFCPQTRINAKFRSARHLFSFFLLANKNA
jgi:hypothetical protein